MARTTAKTVTIEFFSSQRLATGSDRVTVAIGPGATLVDVLEHANRLFPELRLQASAVLLTVNREVSPPDRKLRPGDVVAFVPHIGGG
jgi:molybdopterin converting factor small subunit